MISPVTAAPILDHMAALADPIRCRMLLPLERHELTVNEICSVLQLPQSTVSRHLKALADSGWVSSRVTSFDMRGTRLGGPVEISQPLLEVEDGGHVLERQAESPHEPDFVADARNGRAPEPTGSLTGEHDAAAPTRWP